MSEMLGNQYFMARNFEKALVQYEKVLESGKMDEKVRKKLIICYCEVGNVGAALTLFDQVVHENIELIALTDVIREDCPCPELLERMKWYESVAASSTDFNCILGMLSLYCNIDDSIQYFLKANQLQPSNRRIKRILDNIRSYHQSRASV